MGSQAEPEENPSYSWADKVTNFDGEEAGSLFVHG